MSFTESVGYCLSHYFDFGGRGRRSEYWWFALACFLASIAASVVDDLTGHAVLAPLVWLATICPTVAATARRLHDTDRSGHWQLLVLIPFGAVLLIVWLVFRGTPGYNRFGPPEADVLRAGFSAPGSA